MKIVCSLEIVFLRPCIGDIGNLEPWRIVGNICQSSAPEKMRLLYICSVVNFAFSIKTLLQFCRLISWSLFLKDTCIS